MHKQNNVPAGRLSPPHVCCLEKASVEDAMRAMRATRIETSASTARSTWIWMISKKRTISKLARCSDFQMTQTSRPRKEEGRTAAGTQASVVLQVERSIPEGNGNKMLVQNVQKRKTTAAAAYCCAASHMFSFLSRCLPVPFYLSRLKTSSCGILFDAMSHQRTGRRTTRGFTLPVL